MIERILIRFFGCKVGEDQYSNKYYISNFANSIGRKKRFVIFCDKENNIPSLWHAWLHYLSDDVPALDYKENHSSSLESHDFDKKKIYSSWVPEDPSKT